MTSTEKTGHALMIVGGMLIGFSLPAFGHFKSDPYTLFFGAVMFICGSLLFFGA
jgi:hypothetical protein